MLLHVENLGLQLMDQLYYFLFGHVFHEIERPVKAELIAAPSHSLPSEAQGDFLRREYESELFLQARSMGSTNYQVFGITR
jgi:hypothetical protein